MLIDTPTKIALFKRLKAVWSEENKGLLDSCPFCQFCKNDKYFRGGCFTCYQEFLSLFGQRIVYKHHIRYEHNVCLLLKFNNILFREYRFLSSAIYKLEKKHFRIGLRVEIDRIIKELEEEK